MIEYWSDLKFFHASSGDARSKHEKVMDKLYDLYEFDFVPPRNEIYNAFYYCSLKKTKVCILGQDPYPTPGHANGMAFSVNPGVKPFPRSLQNIFRELVEDTGVDYPYYGDLTKWAKQGILLLNSSLTCAPGKPGSHQNVGWEDLVGEVVKELDKRKCVFVLWGRHAQAFLPIIRNKDRVIVSSHPSPLSASQGFLGSRPFSTINSMIGEPKINWNLND